MQLRIRLLLNMKVLIYQEKEIYKLESMREEKRSIPATTQNSLNVSFGAVKK